MLPSLTKREIRQFHVVVLQRRQINVQESVMYVQRCRFACLKLLLFFRSRCRRHSNTGFSENIVVADTSYQILEVYHFDTRKGLNLLQ